MTVFEDSPKRRSFWSRARASASGRAHESTLQSQAQSLSLGPSSLAEVRNEPHDLAADAPAGAALPFAVGPGEKRRRTLEAAIRRHDGVLVRWLTGKVGDADAARDIAQSAYLRVWRYAEHHTIDNPQALIFKTAANLAANEFRTRARNRRHAAPQLPDGGDGVDLAPAEDPSPERALIAKQDLAASAAAIDALPERARRAFLLSRFEDKSYREIAVELGVSESSVEKYIILALKTVRDALRPPPVDAEVIAFPGRGPGRDPGPGKKGGGGA